MDVKELDELVGLGDGAEEFIDGLTPNQLKFIQLCPDNIKTFLLSNALNKLRKEKNHGN